MIGPEMTHQPVFRYAKGDRTRTYQLRQQGNEAAELWVITEGGRQLTKSRKLMTLTDLDEVAPVVESLRHDLRAGGWVEV
jgi:hypothetical protein